MGASAAITVIIVLIIAVGFVVFSVHLGLNFWTILHDFRTFFSPTP